MASWWRFSGAMVAAWWRHGGVIVALWWRHGGVVVALWWRHGGVMVALVYALKPKIYEHVVLVLQNKCNDFQKHQI